MVGMRYAIDVVYLDRIGRVLKCVPGLRPFGVSACGGAWAVLELAEGTIAHLGLEAGQRLPLEPLLRPASSLAPGEQIVKLSESFKPLARSSEETEVKPMADQATAIGMGVLRRQAGATMLEFVVVAPVMILMGLGTVQYGLLFFAKNNINYATFEAARAGAMANANIGTVTAAYKKALIPLYGGGRSYSEITVAYDKVKADLTADTLKVELLNPTRESFDDWNAKALQDDKKVGNGRRVIPVLMQNYPQALGGYLLARNPKSIGPSSGQNLADASLIKVRIIHGYEPKIPVIGKMMSYLGGYNESNPFKKKVYDAGRIPIVSHVTMQMQSDAIEGTNATSPGMGNNGSPVNPGPSSDPDAWAPPCTGTFCSVETQPPCDPAKNPNCEQTPPGDLCPAAAKT
jgi:hypothetical protein